MRYVGKKCYLCSVELKNRQGYAAIIHTFRTPFHVLLPLDLRSLCSSKNDHEPIHVHVVKGGAEARFQVQPEVTLMENRGLKPAELKLAESIVEENKEIIAARWNEFFKNKK